MDTTSPRMVVLHFEMTSAMVDIPLMSAEVPVIAYRAIGINFSPSSMLMSANLFFAISNCACALDICVLNSLITLVPSLYAVFAMF